LDDLEREVEDYRSLRHHGGYKRLLLWYEAEQTRIINTMKNSRKEDSLFKSIGELRGIDKVFKYVESKANSTNI
jgi:hypothetical protein